MPSNIQQNINASLGTAAIATRLSPTLEAKAKIRAEEATRDVYAKENEKIEMAERKEEEEAYQKFREEEEAQEAGKFGQSREQAMYGSTEAHLEDVQKQGDKQETANKASQVVAENKKKQRRNFQEYLAKMQTNLGGTVGDLPPVVQAAIAKQYTTQDRKRMMDKEDKDDSK